MAQCSMHLTNSTDNKLMIVLLFSLENKLTVHTNRFLKNEMSKPTYKLYLEKW